MAHATALLQTKRGSGQRGQRVSHPARIRAPCMQPSINPPDGAQQGQTRAAPPQPAPTAQRQRRGRIDLPQPAPPPLEPWRLPGTVRASAVRAGDRQKAPPAGTRRQAQGWHGAGHAEEGGRQGSGTHHYCRSKRTCVLSCSPRNPRKRSVPASTRAATGGPPAAS